MAAPEPRPLCACGGCGMPSTATSRGEGPPKHEKVHDPLPHCENHTGWIGTRDAAIVALQRGV
jgi:hypothetical protein